MKVSIIVPVYKVENEIHRCVQSLLSQTLNEIEIILIDDGSPDSCPLICDNYELMDKRVRTIHQMNSGLSEARNTGISASRGEYILFVDSDDYIDNDSCRILYNSAKKYDLDIISAVSIRKEHGIKDSLINCFEFDNQILTGEDYLERTLKKRKMNMAVWSNMYKSCFLKANSFLFKKGIYHEDEEWTPRVFIKAKRVMFINYKFYYYIIRDGSISQNVNSKKNAIDLISTCYTLESYYQTLSNKKLKMILMDYLANLYMSSIIMGNFIDNNSVKEYPSNFLKNKILTIKTLIKGCIFVINRRLFNKIYMFLHKKQ